MTGQQHQPRILNPSTGELLLFTPDGKEERCVFTEEAIDAIEMSGVDSIPAFVIRAMNGEFPPTRVLRTVVWAGVNGARARRNAKPIKPERAQKIINASGGYAQVLPKIIESLTMCESLGLRDPNLDEPEDAELADDVGEDQAEALDPQSGDDDGSEPPSPPV